MPGQSVRARMFTPGRNFLDLDGEWRKVTRVSLLPGRVELHHDDGVRVFFPDARVYYRD